MTPVIHHVTIFVTVCRVCVFVCVGAMTGALLFVSAALGVLAQAQQAAAFVPPTPLSAGVSTGEAFS